MSVPLNCRSSYICGRVYPIPADQRSVKEEGERNVKRGETEKIKTMKMGRERSSERKRGRGIEIAVIFFVFA